jgi:demethylmenaquinone methyltransferase/2-methoxy-6-polyprenyl-1,4-benzoquinol methylase
MPAVDAQPAKDEAGPGPPGPAVSQWSGPAREQAVQRMFTAIARFYDLNNSLLSFGLHHRWKRAAIEEVMGPPAVVLGVRSGDATRTPFGRDLTAKEASGGAEPRCVLDLGAGTGDLALLIERRLDGTGRVAAADLNAAMLREGNRKIARRGLAGRVGCFRANAEQLGFREASFDAVMTGFCMRNVGDLRKAFLEIRRVLKPGGRFVCLEFSRPLRPWLLRLYDWYSFSLLPRIGTLVAGDRTGVYEYLPASIRAFPDQERLRQLLSEAGFRHVEYRNLSGGIVAIHVAVK